MPIFLDEAIHLEWAREAARERSLVGITDGSRHLPVAAYALTRKAVHSGAEGDLWAARAWSGIMGAITVIMVIRLGSATEVERAAWLTGLATALCPFHLLYDRLALTDAWLTAGFTTTIVASRALFEKPTRWRAFVFGLFAGLTTLAKLIGGLAFLVPLAWMRRDFLKLRASTIGGLGISAFAGAAPALSLLALDQARVGPFSSEFLWVLNPRTGGSLDLAFTLGIAADWLRQYWTPFGFTLVVLGSLAALAIGSGWERRVTLCGISWLLAICTLVRRDDLWFPRYLLPASPLLIVAAIAGWMRLVSKVPLARTPMRLAALALALSWLAADVTLISRPDRFSQWPEDDAEQYVTGWTSGYGLRETATFLQRLSETEPVVIVRDGTASPLRESLDTLLGRHAFEIVDVPFRAGTFEPLAALTRAPVERRVFLAVEIGLPSKMVEPVLTLSGGAGAPEVFRYTKPGGLRAICVYRVDSGGSKPLAASDEREEKAAQPPIDIRRLYNQAVRAVHAARP